MAAARVMTSCGLPRAAKGGWELGLTDDGGVYAGPLPLQSREASSGPSRRSDAVSARLGVTRILGAELERICPGEGVQLRGTPVFARLGPWRLRERSAPPLWQLKLESPGLGRTVI